jgi:hypothetical protein
MVKFKYYLELLFFKMTTIPAGLNNLVNQNSDKYKTKKDKVGAVKKTFFNLFRKEKTVPGRVLKDVGRLLLATILEYERDFAFSEVLSKDDIAYALVKKRVYKTVKLARNQMNNLLNIEHLEFCLGESSYSYSWEKSIIPKTRETGFYIKACFEGPRY